MDPSFQGRLQRIEVPDLLTFVHLGSRSGLLELERSPQSSKIFFRSGNPVVASSNKDGLRLGDLLLRMGRVSQKDMDRCLARHRAGGHRLGHVLVSEGLLTEDDLSAFLKVQVSEVIFDTFTWGGGSFSFYDDVTPPPEAVTLEMDIQNLLMEGVRRMDERGRLAEIFPDLDVAVESLVNPDRLKGSVNFTPEEWKVFFLVDGHRTVREICQLTGNPDELATLEVLGRLLGANLLGTVATPPPMPAVDQGTLKYVMDRSKPEPAASAEFGSGIQRAPDDARVIVSREAVQYAAGPRPLPARLVLQQGGRTVSFPLSRDTYTLGRSPKNDIVIVDPKVSTFHARVDRASEGFVLVDLKSTNGTFLNGQRTTSGRLRNGDQIQFGAAKLDYVED